MGSNGLLAVLAICATGGLFGACSSSSTPGGDGSLI